MADEEVVEVHDDVDSTLVSPALARKRQLGSMSELGRYSIYGNIAHGGMATVHLGRLKGAVGFERTVAIKRLHPQYAMDPSFVDMFTDEARVASRIQHPNVVSTLDVVQSDGELFLVLEYIHGETLDRLITHRGGSGGESRTRVPPAIASAIMIGTLLGLHAAHEATDGRGEPLKLVHRDISPHNIIVGVDGIPRVLDFGIAKAVGRSHCTQDGYIKGKIAYMPPEQLYGERLDRRADVYAAGVVLWELLTGQRLFAGGDSPAILKSVDPVSDAPSARVERAEGACPDLGHLRALDRVVLMALEEDPSDRFCNAREFARAIERAVPPVATSIVSEWMQSLARETLEKRSLEILAVERSDGRSSLWDVDGTNPELIAQVKSGQALPIERDSTRLGLGPTISAPRPPPRRYTGPGATELLPQDVASAPHASGRGIELTPALASASQSGEWAGSTEIREFGRPSRRPAWWIAAAAVMLFVGMGAGAAQRFALNQASLATATPPPEAVPAAAAPVAPDQPEIVSSRNVRQPAASAPVNVAPVIVRGSRADGDETLDVGDLPKESAKPLAKKRAARRWVKPSAVKASKPAHCAQPFVIDAQGHKVYKRECF
ncbi:MAG: serine/threonine protein kinase [Myxococcales bacterium]|nr:serine/threonine protein kinase [Myxococcales bacterium]